MIISSIKEESKFYLLKNYFTKELTDLFRNMNYFDWIYKNSHGIDYSTGMPDYLVWPTDSEALGDDIQAIKKGDKIIYKHKYGHGGHNIMILTSQILSQAISYYILTKNKTAKDIVKQYCKGITATMKGMLFNKDDKNFYIMARNIIPKSHSYIIDNKTKVIDYSELYNYEKNWNSERFNIANNPYWGNIYVTNTRSKDDLPHIFHAISLIQLLVNEDNDKEIINNAKETLMYIKGFCKTIIKNKFNIPTKNKEGDIYIPKGDLVKLYKFENNLRLSTLLLSEENRININEGEGGIYELIATRLNYYNHKIFNESHISAILQLLNNKRYEDAKILIKGLKKRINRVSKFLKKPDLAVLLLKSAIVGLELEKKEIYFIYDEFLKAIDKYKKFQRWNLWSESVPDGVYGSNGGFKPKSKGLILPEELGLFFEYCYSPYKKGEDLVNINLMIKGLR